MYILPKELKDFFTKNDFLYDKFIKSNVKEPIYIKRLTNLPEVTGNTFLFEVRPENKTVSQAEIKIISSGKEMINFLKEVKFQ